MDSQNLVRSGWFGALLAALAWTVSGILAWIFPGPNMGEVGSLSWRLIESSDATAELGMLAAIVAIHLHQSPRGGRFSTIAAAISFAGTTALVVSTIMWLVTETEGVLLDILFTTGALAVLIGYPMLGLAVLRARVLPGWSGLLLLGWIAYFPLIFYAIDFYGEFRAVFGLVWLALAYAIHAERHVRFDEPALA